VNSTQGGATVPRVSDSCTSVDEADIAAFLTANPELDSRLPAIEERVLAHFGPDARLQREIFTPFDEEDAAPQFHLQVITEQSFDEKICHLRSLLGEERELMAPVRPPLTIGIL
jgi:hypothetical protein